MDSPPPPKNQQLVHFVLFPFMAQGHMIPMVDIAKLLASRPGVVVTIVTTPVNAARFRPSIDRAVNESHLPITMIPLRFPAAEAGLPENCDMLPSISSMLDICRAAALMEPEAQSLFETMRPRPSCIIADVTLPYTNRIARRFGVPRINFNGSSCFNHLCIRCIMIHSEEVGRWGDDDEYFVLPGFPGGVRFTGAQLPMRPGNRWDGVQEETEEDSIGADMVAALSEAHGTIMNTFEELEAEYLKECRGEEQGRIWAVGPVSLVNRFETDKLERGNSASLSSSNDRCISWLDGKRSNSVIYVCMGSLCNLSSAQLIELALGLEASDRGFVWAVRETEKTGELFEWMAEEGYEERVSRRGTVVRGWAPQVLILSHPAIGGFLTHCGWNSCLEGISAGVPVVTWPLFADQFCNEKLIVEVLKTGVKVGAERPIFYDGKELTEVAVMREQVERAVRSVMDGGDEGEERRKRAKELAEMAKTTMENGGSSHRNVTMLIEDIIELQEQKTM
ncbi:unnamed protein product [Linum tenue]|uniref:Glycosyltransferase n=1 Tax=Linum tenue TaxID=586396 RepID=A0AAV0PEB6_9ROSI|nr:unnamed protein product [Linum tenue]